MESGAAQNRQIDMGFGWDMDWVGFTGLGKKEGMGGSCMGETRDRKIRASQLASGSIMYSLRRGTSVSMPW